MLAKLKKTHVARKRLVDMPDNTKLQWFTGGGSPIGTKGRKEKREEELRRWKEIGLVAGDELFDFGWTFEDIEREIDERKEETIRL